MRFDDRLDQKEPKPGPLGLARRGVVHAVEVLEDFLLLPGAMPMPWSETNSRTSPASARPPTTISPPCGEYFNAFESRLPITSRSRSSSPITGGSGSGKSSWMV